MRLPYKHQWMTCLFAFLIAAGGGLIGKPAHAQTCVLPDAPVRPNPADGQSGIGTDPLLQWNGDCVELLTNGGFEDGFTDWSTSASGGGAFVVNNGTVDPPGPGQPFQFAACSGAGSALSAPSAAGIQTLFRNVVIPTGPSATITLRWDHRIRNQGPNYSDPNQEFRVEIRNSSGTFLATAFSTDPGDTLQEIFCSTHTFDLTAYIGQEIQIAFVVQSEVTFMNVTIDNVSVEVCDGSLSGMAAASAAPQSQKLAVGDTWPGDRYRTVTVGEEANRSEPTQTGVYVGREGDSSRFAAQNNTCPPVAFPTGFSTVDASVGVLADPPPQIGYFFSATDGHSVEQTYTLPESAYDRFIFDFFIPMNVLAPGSFVNWNVLVSSGSLNNFVLLDQFTVVPEQTGPVHLDSTQNAFGVPSAGGFDYKIRWEVTNNAASGSHTLGINDPVAGAVQISKQRFDVFFDTVNPPQKLLAQNLEDPFFDIPGTLLRNETYYWRVITKDCCGDVSSPVWSFNTTCPGPPAPDNPGPVTEATRVSVTPLLTWNDTDCDTVLYGAATGTASVDDPSSLYRIDPQDADASFIGPIGFNGVTGLAFSPINGKLYGTCNDPADSSHSLLIQIDPLTGAGTAIGRVNTNGNGQRRVCDLSFRDNGTLFGYGENPHQLITLNLNTGAGTRIGSTGFVGVGNGMAFGPDGTLYATPGDITNNCLVTLNAANGAGACIPGSEGNVPFFVNAMAYCLDSGTMFGVWNADPGTGDTRLRTINLADGSDTSVDSLSVAGVDALAFFEDCNTTYDVYLDTNPFPTTLVGNDVPVPFFDVAAQSAALDPGTTYYWRVVATNCCGTAADDPVWSFTTCALPNTPTNAVPFDGATAQPIDFTLFWTGGGECDTTYDVRLDTVTPPLAKQCEATPSAQCPTGTLIAGTDYYWQVVAISDGGVNPGPIWTFQTDPPPIVAVETPTRNTNVNALTSIQITFSKPVTGVSTNLKVNGGTAAFAGGGGAGPYTYNFAEPADGNVDVILEAGSIAAAGSAVPFEGDAWTYNLDTVPPDLDSETPPRGSSVSSLTTISVTFTEPVTGVVAGDLVRNATLANNLTGSGAGPYQFTFAGQPAEGMVNVALGSGNIQDTHGNPFPGEGWSYQMDLTAPTVTTVSPARDTAVGQLTSIAVTFDEVVTGVDMTDLTVTGTTVTNMTGSNAGPYTFSFAQPADGTINVALAAGGIQDQADNPFAGDSWTYQLEDGGMTFVPADTDADGDVDGVDFAKFAACFNKAGNPPRTLGCDAGHRDALDFDDDNDIDGADFAKFAACFNKAGNPPRTAGCPQN